MSIEGVDFSSTPNADWAGLSASLKAAGKHFAGRYAVTDKSPNGRGITGAEYRAFMAAGIDVFLYWEAQESWMLGGWDAGVRAANNAQANVLAAGMPLSMPVYYSHDIDPEPQHFDAIDDCLRGAASVVGLECVGFYGGWLGIDHCHGAGTARWFVQTIAWEYGRGLHPAACLYQYDTYGNDIAGVDVDLVRAVQANYGQASSFLATTTTTSTTTLPPFPPHRIPAPDKITAQGYDLRVNARNAFTCTQGGRFKTAPDLRAPDATPTPYKANKRYRFDFWTTVDGVKWLLAKSGSWAPAKNFAS